MAVTRFPPRAPRATDRSSVGRAVGRAVGALVAVGVGAALGHAAARHRPVPTFADAVGAGGRAAVGATPTVASRAYALVQAQDCEGLVGALADAARLARGGRAAFQVVVPGPASAADSVRNLLAVAGLREPVTVGGPTLPRAIRALGFLGTPLLVVLDPSGAVRLAAPFPHDPDSLLRWRALLPVVFAR